LAKIYSDAKDYPKALEFYQKSLKLDPQQKQVRLRAAQTKGWMHQYEECIAELRQLSRQYPDDDVIRWQLASVYLETKNNADAIEELRTLAKKNPSLKEQHLRLAQLLYRVQSYDEAVRAYSTVLSIQPGNLVALRALANDALYTRNDAAAYSLFEKIVALQPNDTAVLNHLANLAREQGEYDAALEYIDQSLRINPDQSDLHFLRADVLQKQDRDYEALSEYRSILERNPNNVYAQNEIKELCLRKGNYDEAEQCLSAIEPSYPRWQITLQKARLMAHQKHYTGAIALLVQQLKGFKDEQSLFILLYHGLTPRERSDVFKTAQFREQMEVLRREGYESITTADVAAAWQHKKRLPEKAVLITFDDGRFDSFENADPVLKEFGYNATMFVPVCKISDTLTFFADWKTILSYKQTGRWGIQSHGDYAHERISIGPGKETGLFLANKQWLPENNRLETDDEYRTRINQDMQDAKKELTQRMFTAVTAFAFPEGDFGQQGYSNYTGVVIENKAAIEKYYATGYTQDTVGFNMTNEDPYQLKRLTPPVEWNAEDFRRHLRNKTPEMQTKLLLSEMLQWSGDNKKAFSMCNELEAAGFDAKDILAFNRARIYQAYGNMAKAKEYYQQALAINPQYSNAAAGLQKATAALAPALSAKLSYFSDDNDRQTLRLNEQYSTFIKEAVFAEAALGQAWLKEKDYSLTDNDIALKATVYNELSRFSAGISASHYSEGDNAFNYSLEAALPLSVFNTVTLKTGYENVDTAQAVLHNRHYYRHSIEAVKRFSNGPVLNARYQFNCYNDDNKRSIARVTVDVPVKKHVTVGGEMKYDNASFRAAEYYAPDELYLAAAKLRWSSTWQEKVDYQATYSLGYASEHGAENKVVHSLYGELSYACTESLVAWCSLSIDRTPVYECSASLIGLRYRR
jgi:tetratricopeptide (TPR) repeat protein